MENTTQTTAASPSDFYDNGTRRTEVASEILRQISASDFWVRARWGVKESLALGPETLGLQFNCNKRIKIRITLAADDTYTVEIGRLKGRFDYVKHAETEGVYVDSLVRAVDAMFSKAFGRL